MSKNIFSVWLKNGRVGATMQSLMPSILAVTIAIGAETFSWWIAAIAVLGVWCARNFAILRYCGVIGGGIIKW